MNLERSLLPPEVKAACLRNLKGLGKNLTSLEFFLCADLIRNLELSYQDMKTLINKTSQSVQIKLIIAIYEPNTEFQKFLEKISKITCLNCWSLEVRGSDSPARDFLLLLSDMKNCRIEEFHLKIRQPIGDQRLNERVYANIPLIKEALMNLRRLKSLKLHVEVVLSAGTFWAFFLLYGPIKLWLLFKKFSETLPVTKMILDFCSFEVNKARVFSLSTKLKNQGIFKTILGPENLL